jgi:transposase
LKQLKSTELTEVNKQARLLRSRALLRRFPRGTENFIWFTDEKLFTISTPVNSQNDRVYAPIGTLKRNINEKRLFHNHSRFSKSLMVSVGISILGQTHIHFIEPGVKINGAYYRDVLLMEKLLPDIRNFSDMFVFMQDGAPAHRARETVELLQRETPSFIPPTQWPPNSPDLNPVDYAIWGIMKQKVYRTKISNLEELRQRICDAWNEISQTVIDASIGQWRKRLRACVAANGGHFEHNL